MRIQAWDADIIVKKLEGMLLHCLQEVHLRGADWPNTDSVITFLRLCAQCMNMFYPELGEAKRPIIVTDGATFIFDNGISKLTDHDNYPKLCITGIHSDVLAPLEELGIDLSMSGEIAQLTFRGNQFRYGIGFANVNSALPSALTSESLRLATC